MSEFVEIPASKMSISKRVLVKGVGLNDVNYQVNMNNILCPYYSVWLNMLKRCYLKTTDPSYNVCQVCEEWKIFSKFKAWMVNQNWEGKELDKDILYPGNKIYGPDFCMFLTRGVNSIIKGKRVNSKHLTGVTYIAGRNKYIARIAQKFLGYHDTEQQAHEAYKKAKAQQILEVANQQPEPRVKLGLMRHRVLLL